MNGDMCSYDYLRSRAERESRPAINGAPLQLSLLDLSRAYDDARRIVSKLAGSAAGTGIWYKLDHIADHLRTESQNLMKAYLAEDAQ